MKKQTNIKVPFIQKHYIITQLHFSRDEDSIVISDPHAAKQLNYVVTAIEIFEQYAKSCDIAMKHFHLTIDSNLDDSNGHKYGLGSSAAVLVSVIKY